MKIVLNTTWSPGPRNRVYGLVRPPTGGLIEVEIERLLVWRSIWSLLDTYLLRYSPWSEFGFLLLVAIARCIPKPLGGLCGWYQTLRRRTALHDNDVGSESTPGVGADANANANANALPHR